MPVFNGAKDLARAIDSLLNQTFRDFELIISDNASIDGTENICRDYAGKDPRIRYYRQAKNQGPLSNFRFVWEQAKGDIFFWAPHDDWWQSEFVGAAVKTLDSFPRAAAVMGTVHYIGKDGKEFHRDQPPYGLDDHNTFQRIRSYLQNNITDNLYYSVFRKRALEGAIWSTSLSPDRVIIMHLLTQGPIVNGWGMEYFNQYSFKTAEQVFEVFELPQGDWRYQRQAFLDVLKEIRRAVRPIEYVILAGILFFRQNWHKIFAKHFLEKIRLGSWTGKR